AAVEVKYRPELRGKPIGIGGPPNSRSVLCTASYEARKFSVRAAMPSSRAVRLCPQLILIPPNFELYKKESHAVREIFKRFTDVIEPLSLDEAYLDVTDSSHFGGSATLIAREIRRLIQTELNLTASAGIAPNKFLAKIASDWKKPNGQFVIKPDQIEAFMKDLKIEKIWGVGQVTAKKMHGLGLKTCADIQRQSVYQLAAWFGSRGEELLELAHGIDHRPVEAKRKSHSVSVEETYNKDLPTLELCLAQIPELYESFEERLRRMKDKPEIRGFVVKLKFHDFKGTTHEISSKAWPTIQDFANLLTKAWERRAEPVRLIGIGVRLEAGTVKDHGPQLSFTL
ncbi:MAG: DNA polymerase IV, partial [Bdellovibrionales bacterium]